MRVHVAWLIGSIAAAACSVEASDVLAALLANKDAITTAPPKPSEFPPHTLARLNGREAKWDSLSPALRRAVLWDSGLVLASGSSDAYIQVHVPCGQTMNDIFIDLDLMRNFDSIGRCTLRKPCEQDTINFATKACSGDSLLQFTRCGIDAKYLGSLSSVKGEPYPVWSQMGTVSKSFDAQIFRRVGTTKASNGTDTYSLFTIVEDPTLELLNLKENDGCPSRASFVTPCRKLNATSDLRVGNKRWCVPDQQLGLTLWLERDVPLTSTKSSGDSGSSTTMPILLGVMLILAVIGCVAMWVMLRKKNKEVKRQQLLATAGCGYAPLGGSGQPAMVGMTGGTHPSSHGSMGGMSGYSASSVREIEMINDSYRQQSETLTQFCVDQTLLMKRVNYLSLRFHKRIATGANGEVWRGEYEGQDVAIKRTFQPRTKTEEVNIFALEQFTQEIRLASHLEHPNIVRFIGLSWRTLPELCMVSEYMPWGDLSHFISSAEGKQLKWHAEKLAIACDIANALVYLHSLTPLVIHRDLKSLNVLLDEHLTAKLSDFGLSRERQPFDANMTRGVGTLLWSAPEVLRGDKYNEKADIYSFGIVLSELDTGLPPYSLNPEAQQVKSKSLHLTPRISKGEIRPKLREDCPKPIQELISQCLDLDPDERPPAMQIVYMLHSKIRAALIEAAPPGSTRGGYV